MPALRDASGQAMLPKGIGTDQEVDQANSWMREQPWYKQELSGFGQNPQGVNLSDSQRNQLLTDARNRGVGISNRFDIDPSGNIHNKGMGLGKKILIGAGIGGLALTGLGAAGIGPMAGLLGGSAAAGGAGAAGAAAAGAAAPLASTAIGTGMMALPAGLASGASAAGLGLGGALAGAAGSILPSTAIGSGMATLPTGAATSNLLGSSGGLMSQMGTAKKAIDAGRTISRMVSPQQQPQRQQIPPNVLMQLLRSRPGLLQQLMMRHPAVNNYVR